MLEAYKGYLLPAARRGQLFTETNGTPVLRQTYGVENGAAVTPRQIVREVTDKTVALGTWRMPMLNTTDGTKGELKVALVTQFFAELLRTVETWAEFVVLLGYKSGVERPKEFVAPSNSSRRDALRDGVKRMLWVLGNLSYNFVDEDTADNLQNDIEKLNEALNAPTIIDDKSYYGKYADVSTAMTALQDFVAKNGADTTIARAIADYFGPAVDASRGFGVTFLDGELGAALAWHHPALVELNAAVMKAWAPVPVQACMFHEAWLYLANSVVGTELYDNQQLDPNKKAILTEWNAFMTADSAVVNARFPDQREQEATLRRARRLREGLLDAWRATHAAVERFDADQSVDAVTRSLVSVWRHAPVRRLVVAWDAGINDKMYASTIEGTQPQSLVVNAGDGKPAKDNRRLKWASASALANTLRAAFPAMPAELDAAFDRALVASAGVDLIYELADVKRY